MQIPVIALTTLAGIGNVTIDKTTSAAATFPVSRRLALYVRCHFGQISDSQRARAR
jgi:hypothetical protein